MMKQENQIEELSDNKNIIKLITDDKLKIDKEILKSKEEFEVEIEDFI